LEINQVSEKTAFRKVFLRRSSAMLEKRACEKGQCIEKNKIFFVGRNRDKKALIEVFAKVNIGFAEEDVEQLFKRSKDSSKGELVFLDLDAFSSHQAFAMIRRIKSESGKVIVFSSRKDLKLIRETCLAGSDDFILKPFNHRELMVRTLAVLQNKKRICCIGGGTGLFTLLSALKALPGMLLYSLVNMVDDGGSSGRLRATFGVLPPGDIRRSLVALSNAPEVMNELIQYRFERGGEFQEHSVGNLLLTALSEIKGSMSEGVRALGDILNVQGVVLPVSNTLTDLVAEFEDGTVVRGESHIGTPENRDSVLRIRKVWHEPEARCDPNAYAAILHSDMVIIGPGDLFTSVITNLAIKDIREAITLTKAKKTYLCNLMTRPGETEGLDACDHVKKVLEALGGDLLDYVLVSKTRFSKAALTRYAKLNQYPVHPGDSKGLRKITRAERVFADIADQQQLVRHDPRKISRELFKITLRL